jgi:hypothetical protein
MIDAKYCPFCQTPATTGCSHLALAAEGRDFVRRCVELCEGQIQWQALCQQNRTLRRQRGDWSPDKEDFMWLETAFYEKFLRHQLWFGGMDYEWRSGPRLDQGGFWVLLWSKDPARLWWELRDEFERQTEKPWLLAPAHSADELQAARALVSREWKPAQAL